MMPGRATITRMSESRESIPRPLYRRVQVEAGHRCAIPTCRGTSVLEVHHIVDYAKVRKHEFENLILLCSTCHGRATKGEIDTPAMKQYKVNLSTLNGRYNQIENQLLERFARGWPASVGEILPIAFGLELIYENLILDGIVALRRMTHGATLRIAGVEPGAAMILEDKGIELVRRMAEAQALD
jgi:hypothetical protein